jgi:hypothetical protein
MFLRNFSRCSEVVGSRFLRNCVKFLDRLHGITSQNISFFRKTVFKQRHSDHICHVICLIVCLEVTCALCRIQSVTAHCRQRTTAALLHCHGL